MSYYRDTKDIFGPVNKQISCLYYDGVMKKAHISKNSKIYLLICKYKEFWCNRVQSCLLLSFYWKLGFLALRILINAIKTTGNNKGNSIYEENNTFVFGKRKYEE